MRDLIKLLPILLIPFTLAFYVFYPDRFWDFISWFHFLGTHGVLRPTIIKGH